jgi:hypothetical protein
MIFGYRPSVLTTLLFLLLVTPLASGQNLLGKPTSGVFGLKAGVISRMDFDTDRPLQSEIGSCAQVFADFPQGRDIYLATAFDFYYIGISRANQVMIDASVGLKRIFPLPRARMFLKPAVSVGFAYLAHMGDLPAVRFLSLKLLLETHFTIDAKKAWVGELGLFRAPTGSNGKNDVTLGPGVFLRWGLAFR